MSATRRQGTRRGRVRMDSDDQLDRQRTEDRAVRLAEACARLGFSVSTGEKLLAVGRFPVPELPRLVNRRGSPHRFSSAAIDTYLRRASTDDARVGGR